MSAVLELTPIGVIRTPFKDRISAPRQPYAALDVQGTIELEPGRGFEHAVSDLSGWDHIWVVFWFHLNEGWRPKVLPPRSRTRRGVFATRSPHRPNPIGLSVVRLDAVEGLTLRIRDVDMIDGTPVLDIKPYVAVADAVPDARSGWLEAPDPAPGYEVQLTDAAADRCAWLRDAHGVDLEGPLRRVLELGPEPHPYRRIRAAPEGGGLVVAVKAWRASFAVEGRMITVHGITTGYRPRELLDGTDPERLVHREFIERFGP
jgi:tRNA (adenine37-N6)-methyltransferase